MFFTLPERVGVAQEKSSSAEAAAAVREGDGRPGGMSPASKLRQGNFCSTCVQNFAQEQIRSAGLDLSDLW
jgi:hypothetical protein